MASPAGRSSSDGGEAELGAGAGWGKCRLGQSRDVLGGDRVFSAPCSSSTHHSTQPCTSCLHLLPNLPSGGSSCTPECGRCPEPRSALMPAYLRAGVFWDATLQECSFPVLCPAWFLFAREWKPVPGDPRDPRHAHVWLCTAPPVLIKQDLHGSLGSWE